MISAVTFDFWDTLFPVLGRNTGRGPAELRAEVIRSFFAERGEEFSLEQSRAAYDQADAGHLEHWHSDLRQPRVAEAVADIVESLGADIGPDDADELVRRLQVREDVYRLEPFNSVSELLSGLAGEYRLGLISDTWLTPGDVVRDVMRQCGVFELFTATIFSDETGFLKPHSTQFRLAGAALDVKPEQVIHVGDSERRDVAGAKQQGMKAILLVIDSEADGSAADAVVRSPEQFGAAIRRLAGR